MKKQLFFILVLALFAGANQVFSQAIGGSTPQPVNCPNNAANPIAGVPYDYSAIINPALGSAYWYATTSTNFMVGGARPAGIELPAGGAVVSAATNYMDNVIGDPSPTTTNITWTSGGLAANTPVNAAAPPTLFVVVQYAAPAAGCANNLKVYPIRPVNAFVVDIKNMTPVAVPVPQPYGTVVEQCFPPVQSATYNAAINPPDGSVVYDFGTSVMYFEVVAANFTGSYTPTLRLSGLQGNQTADIDWGVAIGTYGTNIGALVGNGDYPVGAVNTALTNTQSGVSIYVRVTVHNNNFEGIAQLPIGLAVDAVNSAGQDDVDNATCIVNTAFADAITQNLNARPTINQVAPNTFLPIAP